MNFCRAEEEHRDVSEILDLVAGESTEDDEKKTKEELGMSEFAMACRIIAKIGSCGERGVGLSEFVEAKKNCRRDANDDENDDGDDEEEIGDAQYRRRRRRNNGATSNSGGESEMDEDSFESSPMNESSSIERTNKVDPVRAAILEKESTWRS